MEIRPAGAEEAEPFFRAIGTAFHGGFHPDDLAMFRSVFEPERTLAAFEAGEIVGTAGIYTCEAAPAVALVAASATPPRPAGQRALTPRRAEAVRAGGEPVAALWASEAA